MLDQADTLLRTEYTSQPRTEIIPDAIAALWPNSQKEWYPPAGMLSRLERALEMAHKYPDAKAYPSAAAMCAPLYRASVMQQWLLEQRIEAGVSFWTRMQGHSAAMRSAP